VKFRTALTLGRVSNLPTVWTNALAGALLAGARDPGAELALVVLAFSLFYMGGMFLNDAFDSPWDARERPERPIPSGAAGAREVFFWGFGLLAAGVLVLALFGREAAMAGMALAGAITYYDWNHKTNPLSPVVMGLCRALIYIGAALCYTVVLPGALWWGSLVLVCYLIGLTYIAKQETLARVENLWPLAFLAVPVLYGAWLIAPAPLVAPFWVLFCGWMALALWLLRRRRRGDIPRAVVGLIAGISLLDALLIAASGLPGLALAALAGFGFTLFLQRYIAGT
jgi:4-hydroxybenzoate polyprenyltransferase